MPFGVQSAGFNTTTLKKLRRMLAGNETFSAKTLSGKLDIEQDAVASHMQYYGYKPSGEPMTKEDHKAHVDGLAITKRLSKANALEAALSEAESHAEEIQANNTRESAARAEIAELELAALKGEEVTEVKPSRRSKAIAS